VLYDDVDKAKSVVAKYAEEPPMFGDKLLDVKMYREPVPEIPKGLPSRFLALRNNNTKLYLWYIYDLSVNQRFAFISF